MTRDEIVSKLRSVMKQATRTGVDWENVTDATDIESLGFDSLAILDLIYDIQQEFGIELEAENMASIRTVGELVDFIDKEIST